MSRASRRGFLDGSAPSWVTESLTGGGSTTVEQANGGRYVLSTGTSATGDGVELTLPNVTPDAFDGVYIRAIIGGANLNKGTADTAIRYNNNSNSSYFVYYGNIHSSYQHKVWAESSSAATRVDTRPYEFRQPQEVVLLWDTQNDELLHVYQDTVAYHYTDSSALPAVSDSYTPKIKNITQDTTNDRVMNIYELEFGYVSSNRR